MKTFRKVAVLAHRKGVIKSSGFPHCCHEDLGFHSYILQCDMPLHDCRIRLEFTDLDLPFGSWIEVHAYHYSCSK